MTQDEIIEMAKQTGLVKRHDCQEWVCNTNDLEAFAKLVAQHTLEDVAKEFDKMTALGDTSASFAVFVRNMKR